MKNRFFFLCFCLLFLFGGSVPGKAEETDAVLTLGKDASQVEGTLPQGISYSDSEECWVLDHVSLKRPGSVLLHFPKKTVLKLVGENELENSSHGGIAIKADEGLTVIGSENSSLDCKASGIGIQAGESGLKVSGGTVYATGKQYGIYGFGKITGGTIVASSENCPIYCISDAARELPESVQITSNGYGCDRQNWDQTKTNLVLIWQEPTTTGSIVATVPNNAPEFSVSEESGKTGLRPPQSSVPNDEKTVAPVSSGTTVNNRLKMRAESGESRSDRKAVTVYVIVGVSAFIVVSGGIGAVVLENHSRRRKRKR